ncbi:MAG TPA: L-threonylcarbamoyladenylate synthase [Candidatus Limnocylindrales bacterium]
MPARLLPDDDVGHLEAIAVLRSGGLVALPTDTVYGLAVALDAPDALARLFAAKERPLDKAVVLLVDGLDQVEAVAEVGPAARTLAARGWPGGLTLVLPQRPDAGLPAVLTAGTPTIGLRLPDHPAPRALARALGPLPVSSANRSGELEARDAAGVLAQLGERIELVLDGGPARGGVPSTVVDCSGERPRLLRAGAIPTEALAAALDAADLAHDLA